MKDKFDENVLERLSFFLEEVLKREKKVIEGAPYDYVQPDEALHPEIKYWSPNHTTHHDLQWLLQCVYNDDVSFTNQVMNTLVVKFFGPNECILNCLGEEQFRPGLVIDFERLPQDKDYLKFIHENLLAARAMKKPMWGTYELHTSLQTAAKHHAGHSDWSNMIEWIASMKDNLVTFYQRKDVTMEDSFNKLCEYRGIGAYYGYNTSIKLARIKGVAITEDEEFVVAGSGATKTLNELYPNMKKDKVTPPDVLRYLRDNQSTIFGIDFSQYTDVLRQELKPHEANKKLLEDRMTIFGIEVTCCQFSVYNRFLENPDLIDRRKVPFNVAPAEPRPILLEF